MFSPTLYTRGSGECPVSGSQPGQLSTDTRFLTAPKTRALLIDTNLDTDLVRL